MLGVNAFNNNAAIVLDTDINSMLLALHSIHGMRAMHETGANIRFWISAIADMHSGQHSLHL